MTTPLNHIITVVRTAAVHRSEECSLFLGAADEARRRDRTRPARSGNRSAFAGLRGRLRHTPNTKITAHPWKAPTLKRHRRTLKVIFRFVASEPGAHFRCRRDGKPYRDCGSPVSLTLGRARHVFSVIGTDPADNADRTPASFALVVKAPPRPKHPSHRPNKRRRR